jgi:hypothetical protein
MQWHRPPALSLAMRVAGMPALLAVLLLWSSAVAQQQQGPGIAVPRLLTVSPNGAKVGSAVEMVLTGTDLDDPTGLLFSHPNIKADMVNEPEPPPDPKKKDPAPKKKGQVGPTMSVRYKVTVPPDVPLGMHDVRLVNKLGVSNPRSFVVGDLNEVMEQKDPHSDVEKAQRVELNSTINGVISTPTDVDYYVFAGKKGQRVVASCPATSIESRLHAVVELYDAAGKKLGSNRDYRGTDALVDATLPTDGDYFVRLFQFTHLAGGPEYFYRLSITTAPWIDAVFPPVVEPGKPATLTLYGRNLPNGQPDPNAVLFGSVLEKATVTVNVPNDPAAVQRLAFSGHIEPASSGLDGFEYRVRNAAGASNPYLLVLARNPVVADNNANVTRDKAQEVPVPCEVAGRLDKTHTHAWYAFNAKKGDVYSIELIGERLGAPLDFAMVLYNPDPKVPPMIELDDVQPTDAEFLSANQFYTRTSDPARYQFKPAADGRYLVLVKSQEATHRAGPRQVYSLRITPEQPDFRLVVMAPSPVFPEACVLRQAGHQDYTVFVWRRDGFSSEITLSAEGLPPGVTFPPQVIGPTIKQGVLVLSAAADAAEWTGEIKIKGTATVNGQPLVREARAATITWGGNPQQPSAALSRLDRGVCLAVRGDKAAFVLTAETDKFAVPQGDKITVPLKIERLWPDFKGPININALGLPTGITFNNNNAPMAVPADKASLVLVIGPQVAPGNYTIVFRGAAQVPFSKDPMAKQKPPVNVALPATPVTVTVVPKSLATLTVPANAAAKVGAETKVVIKLARQFDYKGEFKVELVQGPNDKGVTARETTIPAGKDDAELVLTVAEDAAPGNRPNLLIRATAMFNGAEVKHEAKFALNITK